MIRVLGLALVLACALPTLACAQEPNTALQEDGPVAPLELTGRVVDAADILDPVAEARLDELSRSLESDTGAQFVIATTPSLESRTIEEYGLALGRGWGLGSADRNDGLILLLAPNDRMVRIEVGLGLETPLPDVFCAETIEPMIPFFEDELYAEGLMFGATILADRLRDRIGKQRS